LASADSIRTTPSSTNRLALRRLILVERLVILVSESVVSFAENRMIDARLSSVLNTVAWSPLTAVLNTFFVGMTPLLSESVLLLQVLHQMMRILERATVANA
jgi:heme/copper-type cytochrome/quinol oxidase subunit 3